MRVALLSLAPVLLAGCVVTGEQAPETDYEGEAIVRTVDRHNLLRDDELFGRADVTAPRVQAFLTTKGSGLAAFREGDRSAAEIIVAESRKYGVSPVYLLARIQTESSLITSGTLTKIRQATGCGCRDGGGCDPSLATFTVQVQCAARLMKEYFDELSTTGATRTGFRVGAAKWTLDGCSVTPANRATAALYTYTPHAGAYALGCGGPWGGSSLVAVNHRAFSAAFPAETGGSCPYGDGLYCGGNAIGGDPKTLYQCSAGALSVSRTCPTSCQRMPVGQNDQCAGAIAAPSVSFVIKGGLFAESAVRAKVEDGLRYSLERLSKYVPLTAVPAITITYNPASTSYCTGTAYSASTTIHCPYGYPISGDNQNYVVNITIHELGHILAQHLIAPPSTRDNCVNEGLASWIAGKYWINSNSAPVDSFRTAARAAIDSGKAYASMDACHLASDAWYKVYASYFEFLEQTHPAALIAVSNGTKSKGTYVSGWRAWLGR